ncbi:MAG: sulfatase, partial [bacterium]|nr:sulfatase [bacterium]
MRRREFLATLAAAASCGRSEERPNVLFIAADDMNDWTASLGGYAGTVHTPNQQRLAGQGVEFTNAHCASPVCNPSRTALLLGLRPTTTGVYNNQHWWRPAHPDVVTIPMHFRAHGYAAGGAGKVFHHTAGANPPDMWDDYFPQVFDDHWDKTNPLNYPWVEAGEAPPGFPFNQIQPFSHEFDWGSLPIAESEYGDSMAVKWTVDFLNRAHDKPFFAGVGTFRPHIPLYVPSRYFDMYPLEEIQLPEVPEDDLDDVPPEGRELARARRADLLKTKEAGQWKQLIQGYLASITYADAQLGRLLDALDASPYRDNTIIVYWSDHGWHLGEKNHIHKGTLWEEATKVPFIMRAPGVAPAGVRCSRPVGLIDIYPTLIELCGLTQKPELDGHSLAPLLRDPSAEWPYPALTT